MANEAEIQILGGLTQSHTIQPSPATLDMFYIYSIDRYSHQLHVALEYLKCGWCH